MRHARKVSKAVWGRLLDAAPAVCAALPVLIALDHPISDRLLRWIGMNLTYRSARQTMAECAIFIISLHIIRMQFRATSWFRREWREQVVATPRAANREIWSRLGPILLSSLVPVLALFPLAIGIDWWRLGRFRLPFENGERALRQASIIAITIAILLESFVLLPTARCLAEGGRWIRVTGYTVRWLALLSLCVLGFQLDLEGPVGIDPPTRHSLMALAILGLVFALWVILGLPMRWKELQSVYRCVDAPPSALRAAMDESSATERRSWSNKRRFARLARLALAPGMLLSARELVQPTADLWEPPKNPLGLAYEALGNGRFDEALSYYDEAERIMPRNPNVDWERGIALANMDRFEEAIESFQAFARRTGPEVGSPDTQDMIAFLQYTLHDYEGLDATSSSGLAMLGSPKPENPFFDSTEEQRTRFRFYQAEARLGKGRASEALELTERALARNPLYPMLVALKRRALFALGRDEEAMSYYGDVVDRVSGEAYSGFFFRDAGIMLASKERWEDLRDLLEREEAQSDIGALLLRAIALDRVGLEGESRRAWKEFQQRAGLDIEPGKRYVGNGYQLALLRHALPEELRAYMDGIPE